jgi:hypothetical protein
MVSKSDLQTETHANSWVFGHSSVHSTCVEVSYSRIALSSMPKSSSLDSQATSKDGLRWPQPRAGAIAAAGGIVTTSTWAIHSAWKWSSNNKNIFAVVAAPLYVVSRSKSVLGLWYYACLRISCTRDREEKVAAVQTDLRRLFARFAPGTKRIVAGRSCDWMAPLESEEPFFSPPKCLCSCSLEISRVAELFAAALQPSVPG